MKQAPRAVKSLPNENSTGQTPASLMIDVHYAKLRLVERWDWARFVKLCTFLRMTDCEVASLVLLPHKKLAEYQKRNTLPLTAPHASSVALNLTLLEAFLMRGLTNDVVSNPFPDLSGVATGAGGRGVETIGGVA